MGAPFSKSWRPADDGVADILGDLARIAGALSPAEVKLLEAIAVRLDQIEHTEGPDAAVAAALEVQRIWRAALDDPAKPSRSDIN